MQVHKLADMKGGWFVGNFDPTVLRTEAAEVAVKTYPEGATEARHVHRVAHELTLVLSGRVRMNGTEYGPGDILLIQPGESTDFSALTAVTTVVVKLPSVIGDKYPC